MVSPHQLWLLAGREGELFDKRKFAKHKEADGRCLDR